MHNISVQLMEKYEALLISVDSVVHLSPVYIYSFLHQHVGILHEGVSLHGSHSFVVHLVEEEPEVGILSQVFNEEGELLLADHIISNLRVGKQSSLGFLVGPLDDNLEFEKFWQSQNILDTNFSFLCV